MNQVQKQKHVLILGGTNFMGKELVDQLNKHYENRNMQIWVLNRGKRYWNNEVFKLNKNINLFYGDRNQHKEMKKAMEYLNDKLGICESRPWTAVIDFSSFKWRDLQSVVKPLINRTELYVFISTDSIYNNSPFSGQPITQASFDIDLNYRKLKNTKISDKYGYDKLKCELYLQRKKNLPFISLRLPDVLGPYDNTSRYWCLLQWIKNSHKYPIELNLKDISQKLSFVAAADVARLIVKCVDDRLSFEKRRSYNLCFRESVTYLQLVELMSSSLNPKVVPKFKDSKTPKEQSSGLYPSVNYTCIDSQLATQQLNWNPISLDQCISESTQFFEKHANKYQAQYKEMCRDYKRKVLQND